MNIYAEPETIVTLLRETDDFVEYERFRPAYTHHYPDGQTRDIKESRKVTKQTKYICIGGPFDGEYKCQEQVQDEAYYGFNGAGCYDHSKIFVHAEHLYDLSGVDIE